MGGWTGAGEAAGGVVGEVTGAGGVAVGAVVTGGELGWAVGLWVIGAWVIGLWGAWTGRVDGVLVGGVGVLVGVVGEAVGWVLGAAAVGVPEAPGIAVAEAAVALVTGAGAWGVRAAVAGQLGQAVGPSAARRRSATVICWSLVAWSGWTAYWSPPFAIQVRRERCRPP